MSFPRLILRVSATIALVVTAVGCSGEAAESLTKEQVESSVSQEAAKPSIPDPNGSYKDSEGGLSFTFLSTGKFYQELMGETSFGSWRRSGDEAEIIYDDGSSAYVRLGDDYVVFNGMRLSK